MEIKYQRYTNKRKRVMGLWLKIAEEFNNGVSAAKIALRYTNPKTGKHYTPAHIYYILHKLRES